ncbi:MAG: hypothetical protein Q8W44_06215 [Candidatus Palauibacterales bacterium]|nr:hypothetical protein [Candidatus Palauibacterales bacterium]
MSGGRETVGVIVAHADVAGALVRAVEEISGIRGALVPLSNRECTPRELERRVEDSIRPGPAVVFVDLGSGSCAHVGRRVGRRGGDVAVITGVNLPMLLDFVFHREMPLPELAERLEQKARAETKVDLFVGEEAVE